MEKFNSYGDKHREEKRKKLKKTNYTCEVSGKKGGTGELHAHHTQPKSLGGIDRESNYCIMSEDWHVELHKACKQDDKLLSERYVMAKRIWNNPEDNEAMERLREIDDVLIPAFINGIMNKLNYQIAQVVQEKTMINAFKTNRDLKLEVHSLEKRVEALNDEIQRLRTLVERKIIHISEYSASHPQIYE